MRGRIAREPSEAVANFCLPIDESAAVVLAVTRASTGGDPPVFVDADGDVVEEIEDVDKFETGGHFVPTWVLSHTADQPMADLLRHPEMTLMAIRPVAITCGCVSLSPPAATAAQTCGYDDGEIVCSIDEPEPAPSTDPTPPPQPESLFRYEYPSLSGPCLAPGARLWVIDTYLVAPGELVESRVACLLPDEPAQPTQAAAMWTPNQPGDYTVELGTQWTGTWTRTIGGDSQTLPLDTVTVTGEPLPYTVVEIQTVGVSGRHGLPRPPEAARTARNRPRAEPRRWIRG